jgi:acetylornithine deacetylase
LVRRGDRLFGRGTADMKGFLACCLRAADIAATRRLIAPLRLAFSHDEETGCIGVRPMIERLRRDGVRPELAIVGEPTSMRIATGHKSKLALRATCCGRAAHSALAPTGLNAIHLAADLIGRLRARQQAIAEGVAHRGFEVPYTTIHVGKIAGGTVVNIVPDRCVLDFEFRSVAADDAHGLYAAVAADALEVAGAARRQAAESDIRVEITGGYPGLDEAEDGPGVRTLAALLDDPSTIKVDFGTEAGLYREALAIPVLVCGPGSMTEGHKPDEFVTLDQLERCDRLMDRLIDRLT